MDEGPCGPGESLCCLGAEPCSGSVPEALEKLHEFWRRTWLRETPDVEAQLASCAEVLGEAVLPSDRAVLQAIELKASAARQRGGAAGIDGWHGNKVAAQIWEDLLPFLHACESHGRVPGATLICQVHIPKASKPGRPGDCASYAASLRPISVLSGRLPG